MIWNKIVSAVYRNEWTEAKQAISVLRGVDLDDPKSLSEAFGHIIAGRLYRHNSDCMRETVTWLLEQPLDRETFAEWVAFDALKNASALHRQTFAQVVPHCRAARLEEIRSHLRDCRVELLEPVIEESRGAWCTVQ